jgi:hypothetical protein
MKWLLSNCWVVHLCLSCYKNFRWRVQFVCYNRKSCRKNSDMLQVFTDKLYHLRLYWAQLVTMGGNQTHNFRDNFNIFPLISLIDIVSINLVTLIKESIGQCGITLQCLILIKTTITSVLNVSTIIPSITAPPTTHNFRDNIYWL